MLIHAEARNETALMTEETGLLGESPCECLSPPADQCEENLTTCPMSTACSYECTVVIEPCKANAFQMTVTGMALVVL